MLRITNSEFVKSAVDKGDYTESGLTEIAFVGKSNVGKSSLINTVLQRKNLAKISSTPGKTKLINFFLINFHRIVGASNDKQEGKLSFVDLPGYGYAKVSFAERDKWKKMIGNYFDYRGELKLVVLLIDLRHKIDPKDLILIEMILKKEIPVLIAATKSDKLPKTKIPTYKKALINDIKIFLSEKGLADKKNLIANIVPFSSLKKTGVQELLDAIEKEIFTIKQSSYEDGI